MEANRKIRIYCPQDNVGFTAEHKPEIFCRTGNHYLTSDFPPAKDFWGHCCGCQRFFPLPVFDNKNESIKNCVSCDRDISERYLCVSCNTISLNPDKSTLNKTYLIKNGDDKIIFDCPACETVNGQDLNLKLHECEILEEDFWHSREKCPFCGLSEDLINLKVSTEDVLSTALLSEVLKKDSSSAAVQEPLIKPVFIETYEENINDTIYTPISSEPTVMETSSKENISSNPSSSKSGCFIFFIIICMCVGGGIFIGLFNSSQKSFPDSSSAISNVELPFRNSNNDTVLPTPSKTPTPTPTPTPSPSPIPSPKSSVASKSFRSNSKIVAANASLKKDSNDYSEDLAILPINTLIKVKDRKSRDSAWYKVVTENGDEGWIKENFMDKPDWNAMPCEINETGYISGGNLRSTPIHSVDEENILAIWNKGAKVRILDWEKGEPGIKTGNPIWYKVEILSGKCSFDSRNAITKEHTCDLETEGYMLSNLIDCD